MKQMITNLSHIKFHLIVGMSVLLSTYSSAQEHLPLSKADSFKLELSKEIQDTTRIKLLNKLAWVLSPNVPAEALEYGLEALRLAEKNENEELIGDSYHQIGWAHLQLGNYPRAIVVSSKALEIRKLINDKSGMGMSYGNIGNAYMMKGELLIALENFLIALKLETESGDTNSAAIWLGNIGGVYWRLGDYPNALKYFNEALVLDQARGNKIGVARHLSNIGLVYQTQYLIQKALNQYTLALPIMKELNNKQGIATILGNMAGVYQMQGDSASYLGERAKARKKYDISQALYTEVLIMDKEIGDKRGIARHLNNMGALFIVTGQFEDAEEKFKASIALSDSIGYLYILKSSNLYLSDLYDSLAKTTTNSNFYFKKSLEYYKEYTLVKDSVFNEQKSKDLGKLEAQHEFEVEETERKTMEDEQIKQENAEKSRRDNLQYSGILIFIVMLFAAVFMLGKFSIPVRLAEGMIFFSFLLLFEFTLVLLDPYIELYSSGAPAIKLGFNALLAGLIFPLHSFFENRLKHRLTGQRTDTLAK